MIVSTTPSNVAAAALAGALLAYVMQPPLEMAQQPAAPAAPVAPAAECVTPDCIPASAPTADENERPPRRLVPVIEQITSFDI